MRPLLNGPFTFGPFTITAQVFYQSPRKLSLALVNLKPLLPGHVLIIPTRCVPRVSQLSVAETTDLFLTVKRVARMIERVYDASSLNIAVQDGPDAGQSVAHVHVHVVPRRKADLDDRGGSDKIYEMMEGEEGDLRAGFTRDDGKGDGRRGQWAGPDAGAERKPRSKEEMNREAEMLRGEMEMEMEGQEDVDK